MDVRRFVVVVMLAYRNLYCAQATFKNSAWSLQPQYSDRVQLPALFERRRHSALACTVECAQIPGSDVASYTWSMKQCACYTSVPPTYTTTNMYTTQAQYSTTSSSKTTVTKILKRICAGHNYMFIDDLNWCIKFVMTPKLDWPGAEQFCNESGGKLAVPDTYDKYLYIYNNFHDFYYTERLWVGGTLTEDSWYFSTGEILNPAQYDWQTVFSDPMEIDTCLSYHNSIFYSGVCNNHYPFFCEEVW